MPRVDLRPPARAASAVQSPAPASGGRGTPSGPQRVPGRPREHRQPGVATGHRCRARFDTRRSTEKTQGGRRIGTAERAARRRSVDRERNRSSCRESRAATVREGPMASARARDRATLATRRCAAPAAEHGVRLPFHRVASRSTALAATRRSATRRTRRRRDRRSGRSLNRCSVSSASARRRSGQRRRPRIPR